MHQVREGLYYNPYFPGGAIAMPKMLADGGTEYDDGTDATEAQQAKARPARAWWPGCWGWQACVRSSRCSQRALQVLPPS